MDVTKSGNEERGTGNGERGTGNRERGSGNDRSAVSAIKIQNGGLKKSIVSHGIAKYTFYHTAELQLYLTVIS